MSLNISSCSEDELDLTPPYNDTIDVQNIDTEAKLQQFLNGAYILSSDANAFGTEILLFGDLLGDKLFVSNTNTSYPITNNRNFNGSQNDFRFYRNLYNVIMNCNMVINNTIVASNDNVVRIKAEAKALRAYCYFTLLNYYSPTPTSGANQEYGVPIVLGDYDLFLQQPRGTVEEGYTQVIKDLTESLESVQTETPTKCTFSKTTVKLILAKVYLTRRASGDAQKALDLTNEIMAAPGNNGPIEKANYNAYFASQTTVGVTENMPETIWELDMNSNTVRFNGVGSNIALPVYYDRASADRRCLLFRKSFYDSFPITGTNPNQSPDVRRGPNTVLSLLYTTAAPATDDPKGVWTNKHKVSTDLGEYLRNVKILRYADVQLSRIEALYLTGQNAAALAALNAFAVSRGGSTYTGADLLQDILNERAKEFYAEGQRFLDLKRYNQPIVRETNCVMNCNIPANDKLFVLPMDQEYLNSNPNLTQYPGY